VKIYYLYRHIRLDKNEPFYVGVGTVRESGSYITKYARAFKWIDRPSAWLEIASKTEFDVEIVFETSSKKLIIEKEKEFINLYKSRLFDGGTLVNALSADYFSDNYKFLLLKKIKDRKEKVDKIGGRKILKIEQNSYSGELLNTFYTVQEAANNLNRSEKTIRNCINGINKSCNWTFLKVYFNENS
jgi:hypothetical protein